MGGAKKRKSLGLKKSWWVRGCREEKKGTQELFIQELRLMAAVSNPLQVHSSRWNNVEVSFEGTRPALFSACYLTWRFYVWFGSYQNKSARKRPSASPLRLPVALSPVFPALNLPDKTIISRLDLRPL